MLQMRLIPKIFVALTAFLLLGLAGSTHIPESIDNAALKAIGSQVAAVLSIDEARAEGLADIHCFHTKFAKVDPITKYSTLLPPEPSAVSGHVHDFCGIKTISSNSTAESLRDQDTSMQVKSDPNTIWIPAGLDPAGNLVPVKSIEYRIGNQSPTPSDVNVPPEGMSMVIGSPDTLKATPTKSGNGYRCLHINNPPIANQPNPSGPLLDTIPTPADCPPDANEISRTIYGHLACWDGKRLGPGLGRSETFEPGDFNDHVTVGNTMDCPNGTKLPFISLVIHWPANLAGGRLTSDHGEPGASLHWDFVTGGHRFDSAGNDFWPTVVDKCLNNKTIDPATKTEKNPEGKPYYITCLDNEDGTLVGNHGVGTVLEAGVQLPPSASEKATAPVVSRFETADTESISQTPVAFTSVCGLCKLHDALTI
jgi:hypothetical protein